MVFYQPLRSSNVTAFLNQFSNLLFSIVLKFDSIIMMDDFNFHIDDPSNLFACDFLNIAISFNLQHIPSKITRNLWLVQPVSGPTHNCGHTLDLVFTLGLSLNSPQIIDLVSDHKCIIFDSLSQSTLPNQKQTIQSCIFDEHSAARFSAILSDLLNTIHNSSNINETVNRFNDQCPLAFDTIAPYKSRLAQTVNPSPWMDDAIRCHRRERRKFKQRWKKTNLNVYYSHMKELLSRLN